MPDKYISLIEASKLCSYSQGYLSLRARQGKLKAVKLGRNWVTTQEWLREYIEEVQGQIKGEEKKFIPDISLQEAAKLCSYSQEYLSLRARQGKLKAVKLGRNWVTTQEWLREYTGEIKCEDEEEKFIPEVKPKAPVLVKEIKKPIYSYIQKVISPFVQKFCQPKFILSSALIILLLISSILFFSPQARTSLINTGEGIANFVFSQKQNITNLPYYLSKAPEKISQAIQEAPASLAESFSQFNQKLSQKITVTSQAIKSKLGDSYIKLAEFFIPGYSLEPSFLRMPEQLLPGQRNIIKVEMPVIQEIVEQVQEITPQITTKEVTRELTREVSQVTQVTETIQSTDLAQLNQDINLLSQRITDLGSQISSKIDYTVPSYAPTYIPSSGLQVSGHALLTTLNVTGSGALGGSLSVQDNASFGNTKDQNTTLDVYSDATFHESVNFDKGAAMSSLTVSGDGSISGALGTATTTVIGDFTVQDSDGAATLYVDSSGQRVGIGATSPTVLLTVGSSTPNQIAQANRYNSAFISGDLEVDGTVYFTGGSTFVNSTVTQLTISDYLWIGDEDADNLDIRAGIWNLTSTVTTTVAMAKGLNFDSGTLVIDPNSGRVGIGTTTPAHLFQIGDISADHYFSVSNLGHATTSGSHYIGGNLTVDGTIDSVTGIDASDLTIEATDDWTGEFGGEVSSYYATSTGLALAYKTLTDLQTAVSNDFHNLGGTDADTVMPAWQWDAGHSGMTPTTTGAGIYLTGSATTSANFYATGYATTTGGLYTQGAGHIGGNLTVDGTIDSVTGIDASDLTIEATDDWTGEFDFHNLGGTDADTVMPAWQWDAGHSGMTPTTTGAGIYLTGSATTTANLYVTGTGSFANDALTIDASGNLTTTGYASSTTALNTQGSSHIGGNLTVDGTIDSVTGIDASDLTIEATDDWTGEFGGEVSSYYATSTGLALAYKSLTDLQTAVSNDFHNLGGTDLDTVMPAWQWDAGHSGMTPTTTGAGIYLTGSATITANLYVTGTGSFANDALTIDSNGNLNTTGYASTTISIT